MVTPTNNSLLRRCFSASFHSTDHSFLFQSCSPSLGLHDIKSFHSHANNLESEVHFAIKGSCGVGRCLLRHLKVNQWGSDLPQPLAPTLCIYKRSPPNLWRATSLAPPLLGPVNLTWEQNPNKSLWINWFICLGRFVTCRTPSNQDPGSSSESSTWVAGAQIFGPLSAASQVN